MLGIMFVTLVSYIVYKENIISRILDKCTIEED